MNSDREPESNSDRQQESNSDRQQEESNSAVDLTQDVERRTPLVARRSTRQDNRITQRNVNSEVPPPSERLTLRLGKRGTRTATLQEKVAAIKRVREGESKASVARDIGIPESTLRGWCKMEHKLLNQMNNMKANGAVDGSSTSESERDSPSSSLSQSPANLPGPSTAGKESVKIEETNFGGHPPPSTKKTKIENDTASTSNAIPSMTLDQSYYISQNALNIYLLQNLIATNPSMRNMFDITNKALLTNPLLNNFSSYSNNTNSLATTSMIGNTSTMSNTINNTPREINGRRTRHRIPTSTNTSMTNSIKTQSPNLTAVEKEVHLVSRPSTSTSTSTPSSSRINGANHVARPTSTRPQHRKNHINDIAQQLYQQQQKKQKEQQRQQVQQHLIQQQLENSYSSSNSENLYSNLNLIQNSEIMREWMKHFPAIDILNGQSVQTNTLNNNNHSIQNNNAIINNCAAVIHVPADIHEAVNHGTCFVTWLKEHYIDLHISVRQVEVVQKLLDSIKDWNRRSIISKQNSIS